MPTDPPPPPRGEILDPPRTTVPMIADDMALLFKGQAVGYYIVWPLKVIARLALSSPTTSSGMDITDLLAWNVPGRSGRLPDGNIP